MRKKLTVLVLFCIIIVTSCSLTDKLGFDTYDYMSESIDSVHDIHDETAAEIYEMLEVLVSDKTVLPTFDNMNNAIREYRDAVLMLCLKAATRKYSGNTELIEKAEKSYPEYTISQIIPESDLKPRCTDISAET